MLKNGVEYSEEEIKVLKNYILKKQNIDEFLEKGEISNNISNIDEFKKFINNIEILYGMACKYGKRHKIDVKKTNDNENTVIFLDFNDILGEYNLPKDNNLGIFSDFDLSGIDEYYSKKYDINDAELKLFLEYNKSINLSLLEEKSYNKLKLKLHNFIFSRFKKIHKIYMEEPLIIGNNVTKYCIDKYPGLMNEEPDMEKIITLNDVKSKIKDDIKSTIGWGIPNLQEKYYNRRPSYLQRLKYNVIKSKTINNSTVSQILNYGHQTGNYNITKLLAERGVLIDEVLAFNGFITPKGLENIELLYYNYENGKGESEPILLEETINNSFPYQDFKRRNISIKDLKNKGLKVLPQDFEEETEENKQIVQSNINIIEYKEPWFKKLLRIIKAKFNEEI